MYQSKQTLILHYKLLSSILQPIVVVVQLCVHVRLFAILLWCLLWGPLHYRLQKEYFEVLIMLVVRLMSKHLPAVSSTLLELEELNVFESWLIRRVPRRYWERFTKLITKHLIMICYYGRYGDCLILLLWAYNLWSLNSQYEFSLYSKKVCAKVDMICFDH